MEAFLASESDASYVWEDDEALFYILILHPFLWRDTSSTVSKPHSTTCFEFEKAKDAFNYRTTI